MHFLDLSYLILCLWALLSLAFARATSTAATMPQVASKDRAADIGVNGAFLVSKIYDRGHENRLYRIPTHWDDENLQKRVNQPAPASLTLNQALQQIADHRKQILAATAHDLDTRLAPRIRYWHLDAVLTIANGVELHNGFVMAELDKVPHLEEKIRDEVAAKEFSTYVEELDKQPFWKTYPSLTSESLGWSMDGLRPNMLEYLSSRFGEDAGKYGIKFRRAFADELKASRNLAELLDLPDLKKVDYNDLLHKASELISLVMFDMPF